MQFEVYNAILRRSLQIKGNQTLLDHFIKPDAHPTKQPPAILPEHQVPPELSSSSALESVYTEAERLTLRVFNEKFDPNGDLRVDRKELNLVIQSLLQEKNLNHQYD
jgi:hypothetical protein